MQIIFAFCGIKISIYRATTLRFTSFWYVIVWSIKTEDSESNS